MADPTRLDLTEILAVDQAVTGSSGSPSFGVTPAGFLPKPFGRLLAEKIALARQVLDPDLDLTSGSVVRKLLEVTALEDARTWAALAAAYDDSYVATAGGRALSQLGAELGLPRPHECAAGAVTLTLNGALPAGYDRLTLPRGARLTTPGGHRVALAAAAVLTAAAPSVTAPVSAFDPGADGDLDPVVPNQVIDRWDPVDAKLAALREADGAAGLDPAASARGVGLVRIQHDSRLLGGEREWSDERYRDLLLRAPRGVWSADSLAVAASLVAGVRQVAVRDLWGGLDLSHSVFGDFDFIERLFTAERDLASPYFVSVLVAPTEAAAWSGPGGLRASVEEAIRDVRPVGIFPQVIEADQVCVGVRADIVTRGGRPLSPGPGDAFRARLVQRLHGVVDGLELGEPVRTARVSHALMSDPDVADVVHLRLLRFPGRLDRVGTTIRAHLGPQVLGRGESLRLGPDQIAVLVEAPELLEVR